MGIGCANSRRAVFANGNFNIHTCASARNSGSPLPTPVAGCVDTVTLLETICITQQAGAVTKERGICQVETSSYPTPCTRASPVLCNSHVGQVLLCRRVGTLGVASIKIRT